jgi:hypothetical protein
LLVDGLEDVARLGNIGKIDLGLDLVVAARGTRRLGGGLRLGSSAGFEVSLNLLRFIYLDGTGMRLLLGDPDEEQSVENRLALDFQVPGQIVDSNLAHPPSVFLRRPVKPS